LDVVLVGSAEGAWQRWADMSFEMVIVDVYTQQLDGIALCQGLRTETDAAILLLTPTWDEAHLLETYQAGVDECIVKPVSPLMLVAKVLAWLRYLRAHPGEIRPASVH
jgi:DNA-binding response OmpR family regulator